MIIMQALACRGEETMVPVFYDTILKKQASRDPQTWKMLDMIFNDRIFDLATIHNFGNLAGNVESLIAQLVKNGNRNDFASTVKSNENVAKDAIETLLKFYDKNYQPQG